MKKILWTQALVIVFAFVCLACPSSESPNIPVAGDSEWTVTFKYYNGASDKNEFVIKGDPVAEPAGTPAKYGELFFAGWFTEKDAEYQWDFETPVTADLTLHAHWVEDLNYVIIKDTATAYPIEKNKSDTDYYGGMFRFDQSFISRLVNAPEGSFIRVYISANGTPVGTPIGWFDQSWGWNITVPDNGYLQFTLPLYGPGGSLQANYSDISTGGWGGAMLGSTMDGAFTGDACISGMSLFIPAAQYQSISISPAELATLMIPGAKAWPKSSFLVNIADTRVDWESSDPSVVNVYEDVDNYGLPTGLIVMDALKPGTAEITVTSVAAPSVKGTITVTVQSPVVPSNYTDLGELPFPDGGAYGLDCWLSDSFVQQVTDAVAAYGGDKVFVVFTLAGGYNNGDTIFGYGGAVFSINYALQKTTDNKAALTGTQIMTVLNDNSLKMPYGAVTAWVEGCENVLTAELLISK